MDKKEIRIMDATETIEITKTFAKNAQYFGTKEFEKLQAVKALYPTYSVVTVRSTKRNAPTYSLSYVYMEAYIEKHDPSKMDEYKKLRAETSDAEETKSKAVTYGEVKQWFLRVFPEFKAFYQQQKDILANVRKAA